MPPRVVRFRVDERRWALPLDAVREVLEAPALLRVPCARALVAGLLLRRGVVVPVYDLSPEAAAVSQVLVLEWADMLNGVRVRDPEIREAMVEDDDAPPSPPCRGRFRFQDGAAERVDLDELYQMLSIPT